jgi:hypothetical protein
MSFTSGGIYSQKRFGCKWTGETVTVDMAYWRNESRFCHKREYPRE